MLPLSTSPRLSASLFHRCLLFDFPFFHSALLPSILLSLSFFLLFQSFCPFSKSPCQLSSLLSSIYICLFLPCPSLTSPSLPPSFFLFPSIFPCAFSLSRSLTAPTLFVFVFLANHYSFSFVSSDAAALSASRNPSFCSPTPRPNPLRLSFSSRCSSGRVGRPAWRLAAAADTVLGCDGWGCGCVCASALCAWGWGWGLLEDEEAEGDCLGSEVTVFDRQQRKGWCCWRWWQRVHDGRWWRLFWASRVWG